MSKINKIITGIIVFFIFFSISLVIFKIGSDDIEHRIVYFLSDNSKLSGEMRKLRSMNNLENDAEALVKEILLGPAEIQHSRYIPMGTKVNSVLLREKVLYLDFSSTILHVKRVSEVKNETPETSEAVGSEEGDSVKAESAETAVVEAEPISGTDMALTLEEVFSAVRKTVLFNFPSIKNVYFTIDSELPDIG